MNIEAVDQPEGFCLVTLDGRFDMAGNEKIALKMATLSGSKKFVVFEMAKVEFLASIGIRSLVMAAKAVAQRGGKVVIAAAQPMVAKTLETAGINQIIPQAASIDEAKALLAAMGAG